MGLFENIWIAVSIFTIAIILITDPKGLAAGTGGNQFSSFFAGASDSQNFIKQISWILICIFFLLTIGLDYKN
jgi:protein translocase SecG subunit